jgi:hypothetical protein
MRQTVWNIILTGWLIALETVLWIAYLWRLRAVPVSDRTKDRRLWSYGLCIMLLMTAWAVSNLVYSLNRPH